MPVGPGFAAEEDGSNDAAAYVLRHVRGEGYRSESPDHCGVA